MPKRFSRRTYEVPIRAAKPEVNRILRKLRGMGLQLEFSSGAGHWRVVDPGTGAFLTTVSNTPSDVNWWHQVRRAVEKAGYSWEGRKQRKAKNARNEGEISPVDLAALANAQQMARLHGEREPQIDDLEDKPFLIEVRQDFDEQKTKEAVVAQGIESARAHRVVSRLLYIVEQSGEEMTARARERNPRIREGGVIHELIHVAKDVSEQRGLRYWKSYESAWGTLHAIINGTSSGMSVWVANLLEATMDELDTIYGEFYGDVKPSIEFEPLTPVAESAATEEVTAPPVITINDAKGLILDLLSDDWTPRHDVHATLVPEQMSNRKFLDALTGLYKDGMIEREQERKRGGGMLYRLASVPELEVDTAIEPSEPEEGAGREQVVVRDSIADRYADALLDKLREVNGTADWSAMEPILSRLDRLAGIGVE